jgi:hypothetical protein
MARKCHFCGCGEQIEEHHILPQRFGGLDCDDNLLPLCRTCHIKLEKVYTQLLQNLESFYPEAEKECAKANKYDPTQIGPKVRVSSGSGLYEWDNEVMTLGEYIFSIYSNKNMKSDEVIEQVKGSFSFVDDGTLIETVEKVNKHPEMHLEENHKCRVSNSIHS